MNWKNKLLAYLHDPPHKPFRIAGHEDARTTALTACGLTNEEMEAWDRRRRMNPDWMAAAADRFPFPRADVLYVDWKQDGQLEFRHPLAGTRFVPPDQPRSRSAVGEDWVNRALAGIAQHDVGWQAKFFRLWRFWPERCAREHNPLLAYLVADTRIPDHTLWHHNALVSALESAGSKPGFLLFQIGPVQEFIRQARKLQDLWSGSYLLSLLISKALATVALKLGPDSVIYPNLRGVPLLDWWWSQEPGLFHKEAFRLGTGRLHRNELLTPSLPNRFLALIPSGAEGKQIAQAAEEAVQALWHDIAQSVHADLCNQLRAHLNQDQFPCWDRQWLDQIQGFPKVEWILHEWASEKEALTRAQDKAEPAPPLSGGWKDHPLHHSIRWRDMIPGKHRESWHGKPNDAFVWALHYAMADWKFAALKNARGFPSWPSPHAHGGNLAKDHLNGKDEVLGGPTRNAFWTALRKAYGGEESGDFKGAQQYGALNVIKRLWPRCYLGKNTNWSDWKPAFESVQDVARIAHAIDMEPGQAATSNDPTYYAVLCMDGDDMGQWVSGVKTPPLKSVLARKAWDYFQNGKSALGGWNPDRASDLAADKVPRPLGPSCHAALSEALSNFGLYCAGQIVDAFGGQMIYAGGDDVLAMLPAARAVDCAQALQYAFRGYLPPDASSRVRQELEKLFEFSDPGPHGAQHRGFLRCKRSGDAESQRPNWPLMVPGPRATASAGIAIGHTHSPMQDTIQAAREAESTAKNVAGKGALCLSILKRSGEAVSFAAPFACGLTAVWAELEDNPDKLSRRFPYRFLQSIRPLLARSDQDQDQGWEPRWTPELIQAVGAELRHVHSQQNESGAPAMEHRRRATEQAKRWMQLLVGEQEPAGEEPFRPALSPRDFAHFWMAWAFLNRLNQPRKPESADEDLSH